MNYYEEALRVHKKFKGKIEVCSKVEVKNKEDLSIAYTPGVSQPCIEISKNKEKAYDYTAKSNLIAVVTDGSAVLGLGDIGAAASIPVMEGKCVLFKKFGKVDAFPICIESNDIDVIVNNIKLIQSNFGGINLEDISAPRCFEIEKKLKEELNIPVFHDDQHGTAIVTIAAVLNAIKIAKKKITEIEVSINGSGAAGNSIAKLLLFLGVKDIIMCDRKGIIYEGREGLDKYKKEISIITNKNNVKGTLEDAIKEKDIFIGVSAPNVVTKEMIKSMNHNSIVLPMANPEPEIYPDDAIEAGAFIIGTGRSDFPNQVNNVLAFPGIFRGALDVRATDINEEMKVAAAKALAESVGEKLDRNYILPDAFDTGYTNKIVDAVKKAAIDSGVSRI